MSGVIRVFWTLVVHVIVFLVLFGLLYFMFGGQDAMSDQLRNQYSDNPDALDSIRSATMWRIIRAGALIMSWSWIMSALWLLIAERQRPSTPAQGASMTAAWVIFLVVTLIGYTAMSWWVVWRSTASIDLAPWVFSTGAIVIFFAAFLAYYFGTAISVKTVMRPSVPLSGLIPNIGGRA